VPPFECFLFYTLIPNGTIFGGYSHKTAGIFKLFFMFLRKMQIIAVKKPREKSEDLLTGFLYPVAALIFFLEKYKKKIYLKKQLVDGIHVPFSEYPSPASIKENLYIIDLPLNSIENPAQPAIVLAVPNKCLLSVAGYNQVSKKP
jgi:hypothetical protein